MSFLKRAAQKAHQANAVEQEPPAAVEEFLVYDAEATGLDTFHDQILQFGGVRCDGDLKQIGEAVNLKVRRLPYVVPAPEAMAVTGFSYEAIDDTVLPIEFEAAGAIHDFMTGGTRGAQKTLLTFNGLRYDDMILRMTWFRNLLDPYPLPNASTTKVDMYRLAQLAFTGTPGNFTRAPTGSDGAWKLETLCHLNDIPIIAHDGLSDTIATRDLAALVRDRARWAWDTAILCGNQSRVSARLSRSSKDRVTTWMFVHREGVAMLKPMIAVGTPGNGKPWLLFDLDKDPASVRPADLGSDMATWRNQGFWKVQPNKMPLLINEVDLDRFGVDPDRILHQQRADKLMEDRALIDGLERKFTAATTYPPTEDPTSEQQIYDRFASYADRDRMREFRSAATWTERCLIGFQDERLVDFSCRILVMTAPIAPTADEKDALVYIRNRAREAYNRPYRTDGVDWTTIMSGAETADADWLNWALETFSPADEPTGQPKVG